MKRKKLATVSTAFFSLLMASTAFAGTWQAGTGENQGKWWYDNGNGSYTSNGWQWIDGNGDGIAESYYFDNNGWLLTNTTTPDGYQVNENGAWIESGSIVSQNISNIANKTDTESGHLRSILVMEKGRPINIGVPMDIYSSGQLAATKYDIVTDNMPESLRDEAAGYYYKFDERGFLVRKYNKYSSLSRARMADVYQYDNNGKLTISWTITAGSNQDAATMDPTLDDAHTEYIYDEDGKLKKSIKTNGYNGKITTYYYYDNYGRLTKSVEDRSEYGIFDGGQATRGFKYENSYTYDDDAKVITCESGTTKRVIDDAGNSYGSDFTHTTYYCDEAGRIIKSTLQSGSSYTYAYDQENRVIRSEMRDSNDSLLTYTEYIYK